MTLTEALQQLKRHDVPIIKSRDVAGILNTSIGHAAQICRRLEQSGELIKLKRGLWGFKNRVEELMLPEYLTSPLPSYVSLQTALFYHGMISQIPAITYAVSPARTRIWKTPLGTISIHSISPELYNGYEVIGDRSLKMAMPEKALIDFLYLSQARSNLFSALPELEFPQTFDVKKARQFIAQIPYRNRRTLVQKQFDMLVKGL